MYTTKHILKHGRMQS